MQEQILSVFCRYWCLPGIAFNHSERENQIQQELISPTETSWKKMHSKDTCHLLLISLPAHSSHICAFSLTLLYYTVTGIDPWHFYLVSSGLTWRLHESCDQWQRSARGSIAVQTLVVPTDHMKSSCYSIHAILSKYRAEMISEIHADVLFKAHDMYAIQSFTKNAIALLKLWSFQSYWWPRKSVLIYIKWKISIRTKGLFTSIALLLQLLQVCICIPLIWLIYTNRYFLLLPYLYLFINTFYYFYFLYLHILFIHYFLRFFLNYRTVRNDLIKYIWCKRKKKQIKSCMHVCHIGHCSR